VVQTYYPDHYAIVAASTHDYASFVERELKYRRWMHYPPFGVLANVLISRRSWRKRRGGRRSSQVVESAAAGGCARAGTLHGAIGRIKGVYRFHLILKASSRKALNAALRGALAHGGEGWSAAGNLVVDVDAQRLM